MRKGITYLKPPSAPVKVSHSSNKAYKKGTGGGGGGGGGGMGGSEGGNKGRGVGGNAAVACSFQDGHAFTAQELWNRMRTRGKIWTIVRFVIMIIMTVVEYELLITSNFIIDHIH